MRLVLKTSDENSRFTPINIHEDEPEATRVKDTMTEERALESGRSTLKDEDRPGYER